jgi:hypothetical protein
MGGSLGCQMLAAAEADLQPERPRRAEQAGGIEPFPRLRERDGQLRKLLLQQRPPAGAELRTLAPSPDLTALPPALS